jgi:hypothetical protein
MYLIYIEGVPQFLTPQCTKNMAELPAPQAGRPCGQKGPK